MLRGAVVLSTFAGLGAGASSQVRPTAREATAQTQTMVGERLTYAIEVEGSTLRMTVANPPLLPGRESRAALTRVE